MGGGCLTDTHARRKPCRPDTERSRRHSSLIAPLALVGHAQKSHTSAVAPVGTRMRQLEAKRIRPSSYPVMQIPSVPPISRPWRSERSQCGGERKNGRTTLTARARHIIAGRRHAGSHHRRESREARLTGVGKYNSLTKT